RTLDHGPESTSCRVTGAALLACPKLLQPPSFRESTPGPPTRAPLSRAPLTRGAHSGAAHSRRSCEPLTQAAHASASTSLLTAAHDTAALTCSPPSCTRRSSSERTKRV